MKEEIIYLKRILSIIDKIEEYMGSDDYNDFIKNEMKIDACIMKIQTLGETVKKIGKYDSIPYNDIIGLRDWISHDYFGLSLTTIWETLKIDIPDLKNKIIVIVNSKKTN